MLTHELKESFNLETNNSAALSNYECANPHEGKAKAVLERRV